MNSKFPGDENYSFIAYSSSLKNFLDIWDGTYVHSDSDKKKILGDAKRFITAIKGVAQVGDIGFGDLAGRTYRIMIAEKLNLQSTEQFDLFINDLSNIVDALYEGESLPKRSDVYFGLQKIERYLSSEAAKKQFKYIHSNDDD